MSIPCTRTAPELWQQYRQNRSPQLRSLLARQNDGLARKIAHRMSGECSENLTDLTQLARIGLLKAVDRFNPDEGAAFSSFAVPYIRGEIQHFLRDHWGLVKVPRRTFERVAEVKLTQRKLAALGRTASLLDCAIAHGFSVEEWEWMSGAVQRKPIANVDELALALDEQGQEQEAEYKRLKQAIARLPKLPRQIVEAFWFRGLPEAKIAAAHQLSISEVQGILEQAQAQLRAQLQEA